MAIIFESGLETEIDAFTTEWDGKGVGGSNTATVSAVAGQFNSGSKGGKLLFAGDNDNCYVYTAVTEKTDLYARVYFKISSLVYDAEYQLPIYLIWFRDGSTNVVEVTLRSDVGASTFHIRAIVRDPGGYQAVYTGEPDSISNNTWYRLEVHFVAGTGADGGIEVKLDGISLVSDFSRDCSAYAIDSLRVGTFYGTEIASGEVYFDDVEVNDADWPHAAGAVNITPPLLTTNIAIHNPVVTAANKAEEWDIGPYIYTEGGTSVAINPPTLQTTIQIHDPVVYAVDVPTAIEPNLMTTQITMFNPTVSNRKTSIFNRAARLLHVIMRG